MLRIGIAGIDGRTGREIIAASREMDDLTVVGGFGSDGEARTIGNGTRTSVDAFLSTIDVLIDFSKPAAVPGYASASAKARRPYVCGVTGLDAAQRASLDAAASTIPVFYARNMSVGIAAIAELLPALARGLAGYDVEIIETHHRRKVDAPSGTALVLAEAVASGRELDLAAAAVHGRSGHSPRSKDEIGIHAIRGGGNAGEHVVLFAGDGEEIRIEHRALSRRTFADGALRAARFIVQCSPGQYGMSDLL